MDELNDFYDPPAIISDSDDLSLNNENTIDDGVEDRLLISKRSFYLPQQMND